jgi:hypothetical protein
MDYNVNRLNFQTPLIIFKGKENEKNIYINHGYFSVGNLKHKILTD